MAYTYTLTSIIPATPQKIYEAWLDSIAHSEMTGGEANMSDEIGAEVSAWDGYITGSNLELVPGERIVQAWRTSEFADEHDDSIVTVTLEPVEEGTLLTLVHSNVPESHRNYEEGGWESQYFEPMKAYFAKLEQEDAAEEPEPQALESQESQELQDLQESQEPQESHQSPEPVLAHRETGISPPARKKAKARTRQAAPPANVGSAAKTRAKRAAAVKGRRQAGRPGAKRAGQRAAPKRAAPKRAAPKRAAARKATARKAAFKSAPKSTSKKAAAKRSTAKRATARKAAAKSKTGRRKARAR